LGTHRYIASIVVITASDGECPAPVCDVRSFPLPIAIAGAIDSDFRARYYLRIYKSLTCGLAGCWLCPRIPSSLAVALVSPGFPWLLATLVVMSMITVVFWFWPLFRLRLRLRLRRGLAAFCGGNSCNL